MDRPSRKTKNVNYCEAKDFEDDEDFAPPSKKTREGNKQEQKRPSSQESNSQSSQGHKSRKPLDVKLLQRDLEAAITLSMLNNTDESMESSLSTADVTVHVPVDGNALPSILNISNCSVDIEALGVDKITPESEKRRPTKDEDDDYKPKLAPDSESDEDFSEPEESEDEEFTVKKVGKTKKKKKNNNNNNNVTKSDKPKTTPGAKKEKPPPKPPKSVSTATRSPPPAKPAARKSSSPPVAPASRPLASPSPAGGRIPKWNPPAQIGKSPTSSSSQRPAARSPGPSPGPGLRLGLSRLVRVKPLHPGVASH